MATVYLEINADELSEVLNNARTALQDDTFRKVVGRAFRRTGSHVKATVKRELPKKYEIRPGEVGSAIGAAKTTVGASGVGCTIPIRAARRSIGAKGFKASGGAHGWASLHRKYRVKAKILKGQQGVLPERMSSYGGKPPFRNLAARKPGFKENTWTREGRERFPLLKVSGIAIPQMPMNRSQPEIQKDIVQYMEKRLEHEIQYAIRSGG